MNTLIRRQLLSNAICALLTLATSAHAQHLGDIEIALEGSQLVTENHGGDDRIFVNEFDKLGGALFTDDPGFEADTGALPAGASIGFNVVQSLWYWDGVQVIAPADNVSLQLALGPLGPIAITHDSGTQPGFTIATASAEGSMHTHVNYSLGPSDAPLGVYGIVLELVSPGYDASEPFLIALNHGLEDIGAIDAGVEALATAAGIIALPGTPGDTDSDGDVDLDDLNNVRNHFGESGDHAPGDTFPFDDTVNLDDLNRVRNNFGGETSVPEPGTLSLVIASIAAGLLLFRHNMG